MGRSKQILAVEKSSYVGRLPEEAAPSLRHSLFNRDIAVNGRGARPVKDQYWLALPKKTEVSGRRQRLDEIAHLTNKLSR